MKLTFIGHACFLCETTTGVRVLLDPYRPGAFDGRIALRPFLEPVDIVASTHSHLDHFHLDPAFGRPEIVRWHRLSGESAIGSHEVQTVRGVEFLGLDLPHGAEPGHPAGRVTGLRLALDGLRVFHPGDLGRPLTPDEMDLLGPVDILLVPVGGTFTIGPEDARTLISTLRPAVAVPMHYRMERVVDLRLRPLDDFLTWYPDHEQVAQQPVEFTKETLPRPTRVLVLPPTHA